MKIWENIDLHKGVDSEGEITKYEEIIRKFLNKEIHPERPKSYRLNFGLWVKGTWERYTYA